MADLELGEFERQCLMQGADMLGQIAAFVGKPTRDQLAAMALQGMLADPNVQGEAPAVAAAAYRFADAMLAERERPKGA